jgi:hypothetical protein
VIGYMQRRETIYKPAEAVHSWALAKGVRGVRPNSKAAPTAARRSSPKY